MRPAGPQALGTLRGRLYTVGSGRAECPFRAPKGPATVRAGPKKGQCLGLPGANSDMPGNGRWQPQNFCATTRPRLWAAAQTLNPVKPLKTPETPETLKNP